MTVDNFYEVFEKLYQKKREKTYVFKVPSGFKILEGNDKVIGMGISPCKFIGIRLSDEDKFYIRDTESTIIYEASESELAECDNIYKDIFKVIDGFVKVSDIRGAQILLHNECPKIVPQSFVSGIIMSFFHILNKPVTLYDYYSIDDKFDSCELAGITAFKNRMSFFENGKLMYYPANFDNYKIVIILPENAEAKSSIDSLTLAEKYLKSGNIQGLADILKERLENCNCKELKLIYNFCKPYSEMCGIYNKKGIFAFIDNDKVDDSLKDIDDKFFKETGTHAEFYICEMCEKTVDLR